LLIKPQMLFLDEASSAMDENIEHKSYKLLKDNLPDTIMISVGHRSTLLGVHRYALLSEDNATWKFTEASAV
ncbi:MAG: ABC transporter ATP-binding protein/permease, partial [Succinivibrio sp.]|nr:ABC transporter ATP-binding protein/permease [Succinivibrio sp.]